MARKSYRRSMRGGRAMASPGSVQRVKSRARKLYAENKKKTMWFGAALLAGVAAYVAGYIKFDNPKKAI